VFCVLVVVAAHLLFVGVGTAPDGGLAVSRPAENQPWFDAATWVGQVMPLFFVVGGFASITAWRSTARRGGTAASYVSTRLLRLAQPALPLFLFYLIAIAAAHLGGVDPVLIDAVVVGAGSPLWFLAAYTLCQALVPAAVTLHTRAPVRTVVGLFAGVLLVDALQFGFGAPALGYLNLVFVWVLVQQFGFWYADGWFDRRRWWQLLLIAVGSWACLVPLTTFGPYNPDMLTNLNPPTLPLVLIGLGQACLLRLLKPVLSTIMRGRAAQATVYFFGSRLMTIYLWHLPVIIVLAGLTILIPGAGPEPASALWWWTRIPTYLLVLGVVFLLSLAIGRWEHPRPLAVVPPSHVVVLAAVITFLPPLAVTIWGLDIWIAFAGSVLYASALLLIRWPQLSSEAPAPVSIPAEEAPLSAPRVATSPNAAATAEPDGA
jgi:hypothetical protein